MSNSFPNPIDIINEVCAKHGVTYEDLRGFKRRDIIIKARYEAMFLIRQKCRMPFNREKRYTFERIGQFFDRHHSTVQYACNLLSS